jgi:hypothetical protein
VVTAQDELDYRLERLASARSTSGDLSRVPVSLINDLRIFYGGRGIWYDAVRTRQLAVPGVTVGILHTGRHYDDQLDSSGIIYNYPVTGSPGKDSAEVQATKNAGTLGLPVFVVVGDQSERRLHQGWVADWDDAEGSFLLTFDGKPAVVAPSPIGAEAPFIGIGSKPTRKPGNVADRPGQQRFAFEVKKRSGSACGLCRLDVKGLVDAAHIIPKEHGGTDDPRNGLPLCPTHHRAFDTNLVGIVGPNMEVVATGSTSLEQLRVTVRDLNHLPMRPHPDAVTWRQAHLPTE